MPSRKPRVHRRLPTSPTALAVLAALRASERPLTAQHLADHTHYEPNTVRATLAVLAADGQVTYTVAGAGGLRHWRIAR